MIIKSLIRSKKVLLIAFTLIFLATSLFLPKEVFAGEGNIDKGIDENEDGIYETPHKLNLNLLLMYDADQANIDLWEEAFNRASKLLYNSTEGQMQIGTVNVYVNESSAENIADVWVSKDSGRAYAKRLSLGGSGRILLYQCDRDDFEETKVLTDSYRQNWIPNTPNGFGSFYTSVSQFPAFDDLDGGKVKFKSGTIEVSFGKHLPTDTVTHWVINGTYFVATVMGYINLYNAKIYYNGGWNYVYCPISGAMLGPEYGVFAGTHEYGFSDTEKAAVVLMALNGKYVLYIARKNYAGGTVYNRFYETQEVPMAVPEAKMRLAKQGGSLFVDLVHSTEKLGVVSFTSSPSVDFPLQKVVGDSTKEAARNAINALSAGGATNIGGGLRASLNQIVSAGDPSDIEFIVLISDGVHNTGENPSSVITDLQERGVRVFTIGLGADADRGMLQNIADETGGKFFFAASAGDLPGIFTSISAEMRGVDIIKDIEDAITASEQIIESAYVDTFNKEVTFMLEWGGSDLDLTLKRPDGTIVNPAVAQTDSNIEYVERDNYEFYRIQKPMAGEWQLIINAVDVSGEEPFTLQVLGEAMGVLFNVYTDKASYTYPESILIQADVIAIDYVANAEVTGTVERPDGSTVSITLFDDGLESHSDKFPDDGVYSNYFSEYTKDGVYTFNMVVDNKEGIQAPFLFAPPPEGWTPEPISPFTREASVSVFYEKVQPTELTLDFPSNIQYSDMLSGKATLTSDGIPLENMEIEFGCMLPTETLKTNATGEVYNTSYKVEEASGMSTDPVCVNFYGDLDYLPSYGEQYIIVEKENATLAYSGDTSVIALNPINLSANVSEEQDGSPGDITLAGPVSFEIYEDETLIDTYNVDIVEGSCFFTIDGLGEGLYTVSIKLSEENQYYQAIPISVDLEIYLPTITYSGDTVGEYSDETHLEAIVMDKDDPVSGKLVEFTLGSQTASGTTDENGVAEADIIIGQPYRKVDVKATTMFGPLTISDSKLYTIAKETVTLTYNGDTLVQVGTPTTLSCKVVEESDGSAGDITLAGPLSFEVFSEGVSVGNYQADNVNGLATISANLGVGVYYIVATINSDYYTADPSEEALLAVYDPAGSFVTGGGWFVPEDSTGKVNFGFEVKYKKDGSLQGNLEIIDHNTGTNYKATGFSWLVVVNNKAYFYGYLEVDWEGSYPFMAIMEDNGSPGKNKDKFNIDILIDGEHIVFNKVIGSGDISIHK